LTCSSAQPSVGEKKAATALRAVMLGAGVWLAPYSLVQDGDWAAAVVVLALALVALIAGLSRFPSAAARWIARKRGDRYLSFSALWFSCGGLLVSVLVAAFPAAGIAAGIPLPGVYWALIGGAAASAAINLWALLGNIVGRPRS